jgi:hypothetical protein
MPNDNNSSNGGEWVDGVPVQSEKIAFGADEMVACTRCSKRNPPNRTSCLYCAQPIDLPEDRKRGAKLNLRPLENWEKGFNIIFVPPAANPDTAEISRFLSIDPDILRRMIDVRSPFPIARLESGSDAAIAVERLQSLGLNSIVVTDETLKADKPPIRIRAIAFLDDSIVATTFNTGEHIEIGRDELLLIVPGSVIESKTESVEKRKKKESKLIRESETSSEEKLIDIYTKGDPNGFQIQTKGFDFSCLGADKGLIAAINIDRLVKLLLNFATSAKTVDEYRANVGILNTVWEPDMQRDFHGITRTGLGQSGYANVAKTSNQTQFTKYSRLQQRFI